MNRILNLITNFSIFNSDKFNSTHSVLMHIKAIITQIDVKMYIYYKYKNGLNREILNTFHCSVK